MIKTDFQYAILRILNHHFNCKF